MEGSRFAIVFEKPEGVYYGGQTVDGVVCIQPEQPLQITGIQLRLYGGAHISWTQKKKKQEQKSPDIEHHADEIYFDDTFILWGQEADWNERHEEELSPGKHMFPFHYKLPADLPCSFEGQYGGVRYYVQCFILQRACKTGVKTLKYFTVVKDLDLNDEKHIMDGIKEQREILLRSNCFRTGRLLCTIGVSRGGYVPGEKIYADIQISNMSGRKIKSCSLTLRQVVRYGSEDRKCRTVIWDLKRVHGDIIKPHRNHYLQGLVLDVPPIVPSRLAGCKFIDIKYELAFNLNLHPVTMSTSVPIVIGSIPHRDSHLACWEYQEQYVYPSAPPIPIPTSEYSDSQQYSIDDQFLPKSKVYRFVPADTIACSRALEASPSIKRKLLTLGDQPSADNQESVV